MTEPITYSLKNQHKRSDQFYLDLSGFTDVVLDEIKVQLGSLIDDIEHTPGFDDGGADRNWPEYAFDALLVGVLWRVYAPKADTLDQGQRRLMGRLLNARRSSQLLKPFADFLRGLISGVTLFSREDGQKEPEPTLENLTAMIEWMRPLGEFEEEVKRLEVWRDILAQHDENYQKEAITALNRLAAWFDTASRDALGDYTPNVDHFLLNAHPRYRWREDYLFTGRQRVEYHLNMVGTEIMNRSFRGDFLQAEQGFIFVPPCMSSPKDGKCQAVATPYGERCAGCTPTCQVHQVTKLGEKHGFQVFMIPDSFSPLASTNGEGLKDARIRVVGVSCPLTIISGGFEMKRMGIPAQGLLLDHCGCSWHWDPGKGIVTEINIKQLARILEGNKF